MQAKTLSMFMILMLLCSHISIAALPDCAPMASSQNQHQMAEMMHGHDDVLDSHQMNHMDHNHHQMMEQDNASQQTQCCGADCRCPAGINANLALISEHGMTNKISEAGSLIGYFKNPLPAHLNEQIKPPTLK